MTNAPWLDEPTALDGIHNWVPYALRRKGRDDVWLGYVWVPHGHPWHSKDTSDLLDINVHGGITFSRERLFFKHFLFELNGSSGLKDGWWVGFDCGHPGDFIPSQQEMFSDGTYRTMGYAAAEVKRLCTQAANA